jgi:hypothetical protein
MIDMEPIENMLYVIPILTAMASDDEFARQMYIDEISNNIEEQARYVIGLLTFCQLLIIEIARENAITPLEVIRQWSEHFHMFDPNQEIISDGE